MNFRDYLNRNPVGGATPEENYNEDYVINILVEPVDLNLKYVSIFADQSKHIENKTKLQNNKFETQNEQEKNQSQTIRTFENVQNVNNFEQSEATASRQPDISTPNSCRKSTTEKMNQEYFYHWGETREIMEIIRRRNNSPETRRLVEQRNALSRPGLLRRQYDQQSQGTIFAPSRPYKRSREEVAEIDAELRRRTNRLGGRYHPIQGEPEENPEEGEIDHGPVDTEKDSIILRGDNLPIFDLSKYNTDGKEAKYIQINHFVGNLTCED